MKARALKRSTGLLLALSMIISLCCPAFAAAESAVSSAVSDTALYILNTVKTPQVSSVGGEWAILGLARSGCDVPEEYFDAYYENVEEYVRDCNGVLSEKKYTEYSRIILALTSIGRDPSNVSGYNLLTALGDFDKTVWQGINGAVFALLALDSGGYDMPVNSSAATQATRGMYVDGILSRQLADGGFSLAGTGSAEPDITAMALQALSKYQERDDVKAATEKALACLSDMQASSGGFADSKSVCAESAAQVIVALTELGVPLDDSRFVKNSNSLVDNLLTYYVKGNGFTHDEGNSGDQMATEQAFYALVAALRAENGKNSLYRMSDAVSATGTEGESGAGLPGKNDDVKACPVTNSELTFNDISGHKNQRAIEALASRGIISGMGNGAFSPDSTMTRAQLSAIIVRGLGLMPEANTAFTDVPSGAWYSGYVGSAYTYGIVNGTSATAFSPDDTVTRQEAAVMLARAAKLCGVDTELTSAGIRDMLAQFGDYVTVSSWAQSSVAFCYKEDILSQSDLNIRPGTAILRCELAQMLYNMLSGSKLL